MYIPAQPVFGGLTVCRNAFNIDKIFKTFLHQSQLSNFLTDDKIQIEFTDLIFYIFILCRRPGDDVLQGKSLLPVFGGFTNCIDLLYKKSLRHKKM